MAFSLQLKLAALCCLLLGAAVVAARSATADFAVLSLKELEQQLEECQIVQDLNALKRQSRHDNSSLLARLFAVVFPSSSPAVNALLATLYISGPPTFLLTLCPPDLDPSSLSVMVAFAVGGIMGDTLFHLLPEIFLGEDDAEHSRFVLVEPNRNLLLGVAILVGFMTFVAMDKGLRIGTGGEGHDHSHGHSHDIPAADSVSSSVQVSNDKTAVRKREKQNGSATLPDQGHDHGKEAGNSPSTKLKGYMNMIADFTHNITDGLAMSASFYASPTVGATTAAAVFLHEIPHQCGDAAMLLSCGFSKRAAIGAQFVTALGALLGTIIGIVVQEFGSGGEDGPMPRNGGLWGTSLTWGDMMLPFTAGTFLYVATVGVIPELLETGPNKVEELRKTLVQFVAIAAGAGIMLYISWQD